MKKPPLGVPFRRYAVYYIPPKGALGDFGSTWLGWDSTTGKRTPPPVIKGLPCAVACLTQEPHRYGFHATLRPPFALAAGQSFDALRAAFHSLCAQCAPARVGRLCLAPMGARLVLRPVEEVTTSAQIKSLAATAVAHLNGFRPPAQHPWARHGEVARSAAQRRNLRLWGFPWVMEDFRFHITLTGRLCRSERRVVAQALMPVLAPILLPALRIESLSLVGEAEDGMFHQLCRAPLRGPARCLDAGA
ncbi:MAG: DUF1045 domain-containing protein [Rhodobacteraceae bacterium]|nr:DUF1045 domain-containing protein [Paracoccaceae bacterium]